MNLNGNIDFSKIKFDPRATLAFLKRTQAVLVGLALVGVFAYTAYVVNAALNATPVTPTATAPLGVSFDKATLDSLETLSKVPATLPTPSLGKSDPFGNN